MADRLPLLNPALYPLPNPSSTAPRTPPRPGQSTDAIIHSTPQSAHISSQPPEDYLSNNKVPEQEEWLKEDLNSTVLVGSKAFNDLVLAAAKRIKKLADNADNFRQFLQDFSEKNKDYQKARKKYLDECQRRAGKSGQTAFEKKLYAPFVNLCNTIIQELPAFDTDRFPSAKDKIHFYRQDPFRVQGSLTERKVDIGVVVNYSPKKKTDKEKKTNKEKKTDKEKEADKKKENEELARKVSWDTIVHWDEMKRLNGRALATAQDVRYVAMGEDAVHGPEDSSIAEDPQPTSQPTSQTINVSSGPLTRARARAEAQPGSSTGAGTLGSAANLKRSRDEDMYTTSANKKQRSSRVNTTSTSRPTAPTDEPNSDDENRIEVNLAKTQPNKLRKKIQLQMAGYALEMLSSCLFRSHTIGMLVDTQQIQLGYYDHSSILLSAPFSIDTDEIHFLETLYHLRALSLSGRGVVSRLKLSLKGNPDDLVSPGLKPTTTLYADAQVNFGSQLLILGNVLYRARSIVGRGTIVIEAAPKEQPDAWLYTAKYSFPPATRHSEASLILSALRTAKQRPEWSWVENHLPNLKFWEDVELTDDDDDEDFPHERIKLFLDEHCPDFGYEKRVLRILVQDRLEPLTSLSEEVHYAQVFCDVLQAHRWLYDHCQILHRDISMNNIMVRKVDGKIFGVLNDLDLASRATKEMSATSKHRTGTRPFMAYELLDPKKVVSHLYRHDLESFFYVMLCLCCRYNLDGTRAGNEYDEWFTRSALDVKRSKTDMFTQLEAFEPPVTPDFSAFEPLLVHIHGLIKEALVQGLVSGIQGTPFDPETGNNRLTYENFLDNLKTFDNENFTIHYLSPSPLPAQPVDESVLEEDQREMRAKMGKWLDEDSYLADSKPSGKARKGKARNA